LTRLLRKDGFSWSAEADKAFSNLKTTLTTAPVLQLPDFTSSFIIECDASGSGFGAVLHQGTGPIAFFSRPIAERHQKLAAYERELIGLVQAVRHWRPYVWGRSFTVRTDHYALKFLLDQRLSTIPQNQWVSKLFGYDFSVEFKPGAQNIVADALSRRDTESGLVFSISSPRFTIFDDLKQAASDDPALTSLRTRILAGELGPPWGMVDGVVCYDRRAHVPADSAFVPTVLAAAHDTGHEGIQKTLHRLRRDFHISQDRQVVRDYIHTCTICQRNKTEHLHPAGLLRPLEVPSSVWSDISMDFIEGLPKVGGKSVILMVVDRFSKYAHFIPLAHPYSASTVARAFFDDIVRLHGIPLSIVSDRDPVFTSNFWKDLFAMCGTSLRMSTAFHPQTDGQSEAVNKTIAMYLRCMTGDRPRQWVRWLPWAEFCYNSSFHSALKTTPFRVVYGRDPPALPDYEPGHSRTSAVDSELQDRDLFLSDVRSRLLQAQEYAKLHYDGHHRELHFAVGDWVWLRLHHRAANSLPGAAKGKLGPHYYGPYRISAKINEVAYRLELPPSARIHDVFHVSLLKTYDGPPPNAPEPLPPLLHGKVVPTPIKAIRARRARDTWKVLIQWEGMSAADASWEDLANF
jgi:hypothetical protein